MTCPSLDPSWYPEESEHLINARLVMNIFAAVHKAYNSRNPQCPPEYFIHRAAEARGVKCLPKVMRLRSSETGEESRNLALEPLLFFFRQSLTV